MDPEPYNLTKPAGYPNRSMLFVPWLMLFMMCASVITAYLESSTHVFTSWINIFMNTENYSSWTQKVATSAVVVQWLNCSPVTQEPGVRFPSNWRESGVFKLMWRRPGGHGINYTLGTAQWHGVVVRLLISHSDNTWPWSCVKVLGKPFTSCHLCPPGSDVYLVERESWIVMIGYS